MEKDGSLYFISSSKLVITLPKLKNMGNNISMIPPTITVDMITSTIDIMFPLIPNIIRKLKHGIFISSPVTTPGT